MVLNVGFRSMGFSLKIKNGRLGMENNRLATRLGGQDALQNLSMTPYERVVAQQLHLSRLNSKAEADPMLDAEFLREFEKQPIEHIEWAFREHRRQSQFFPSIAEVSTLIARRRRELW